MKSINKRSSMVVIAFGFSILLASNSQPNVLPQDKAGGDKNSGGVEAQNKARLQESYSKLPLSFEANQGQSDSKVKFISRGSGYTLFFTDTEAVLTLKKADPDATKPNPKGMRDPLNLGKEPRHEKVEYTALRMKLEGANTKSIISGLAELPGKVNYFIGNDPAQWHTNIPTYAKVQFSEVYPGINLVYYGNKRQLEYDLIVGPGADPNQIKLAFEGADKLDVDPSGDLILKTEGGELHLPSDQVGLEEIVHQAHHARAPDEEPGAGDPMPRQEKADRRR